MDVAAQVARYKAFTQQKEKELLKLLLEDGWEGGCWIRPAPELILTATQGEIAEFLEVLRSRDSFYRKALPEPYPDGRHQTGIDGEDPCYIILSQRCDIVSPLKTEPLVELAPATFCADKKRIHDTWKNSPREFPIDRKEHPTFIVDYRYRFFISKLDLFDMPCQQALPLEENVRLRFVLRTSQRYMRSAVPDHLVESVVKPLKKLVCGDDEANKIFSEWALFHGGQREKKPGIVAIYYVDTDETRDVDEEAAQEDEIVERAENKFEEIIRALPQAVKDEIDDDRTEAISDTRQTLANWRLSWKMEWDNESFGNNPSTATPSR
jgi:hypothetical protein